MNINGAVERCNVNIEGRAAFVIVIDIDLNGLIHVDIARSLKPCAVGDRHGTAVIICTAEQSEAARIAVHIYAICNHFAVNINVSQKESVIACIGYKLSRIAAVSKIDHR